VYPVIGTGALSKCIHNQPCRQHSLENLFSFASATQTNGTLSSARQFNDTPLPGPTSAGTDTFTYLHGVLGSFYIALFLSFHLFYQRTSICMECLVLHIYIRRLTAVDYLWLRVCRIDIRTVGNVFRFGALEFWDEKSLR